MNSTPTRRQILGLLIGVAATGISGLDWSWLPTPERTETNGVLEDSHTAFVYIYGGVSAYTGEKSCKHLTLSKYEEHLDKQLAQLKQDMLRYMKPRLLGEIPWDAYPKPIPTYTKMDPDLL